MLDYSDFPDLKPLKSKRSKSLKTKNSKPVISNKFESLKSLPLKKQIFLKNYINNGFNATKAYLQTYENAQSYNAAGVSAHNLLKSPKVQAALAEILQSGIWWSKFKDSDWANMGLELYQKAKREETKTRVWEILGKAKHIFKDNQTNIAIFSGAEGLEKKILERRRDILNAEFEEVSEDNKVKPAGDEN